MKKTRSMIVEAAYAAALNEDKDEEKKSSSGESEKKISPDDIVKELMMLDPKPLLNFIYKQDGSDTAKAWLLKNIGPFVKSVVKNGWYKAKDLGKAVKDFSKKNKEDSSDIDYENAEIDSSTIKTIYAFDDEALKKVQEFIEKFKKETEGLQDEVSEKEKEAQADIKKAGVKVDDKTLGDHSMTVLGVIDDEENKGKSGKELTKEVEKHVKQAEEVKQLKKREKELAKKMDAVDVSSVSKEELKKVMEETPEESKKAAEAVKKSGDTSIKRLDDLRKKLRANAQKKISKDFKESVQAGIFKTKDFEDVLSKNGFKGTWAVGAIKTDYTAAVRVDYYDDEAGDVVEKDEGSGYKVNPLKGDEKNKDLKKITDYLEGVMKDILKDGISGKIYKYRKRWAGDNPDGNFDQIFVFCPFDAKGLKEAEEIGESQLNEAAEDLVIHAAAATSLVDDQAIKNAAYTFAKTCGSKEEALDKFTTWLTKAAGEGMKGPFSALDTKDLERTTAGGITVLKSLQTYASNVFDSPNKIADQVSQKIIDSVANGDSVDVKSFGVEFVSGGSKKFPSFDRLISAMNSLKSGNSTSVEKAAETIKQFNKFAKEFPKDNPFYNNATKAAAAIFKAKTGNSIEGIDISDKLVKRASNFEGGLSKFANNLEAAYDNSEMKSMTKSSVEAAVSHSSDSVDGEIEKAGAAKDAAKSAGASMSQSMDDAAQKIAAGEVPMSKGIVFNYSSMSKEFSDLEDIMDDGKISPEEYKKFIGFENRLMDYQQWAAEHAGSKDPQILAKVAAIKNLSGKVDKFQLDNFDEFQQANEEYTYAKDTAHRLGEMSSEQKAAVAAVSRNEESTGFFKKLLGKAVKVLHAYGRALSFAKIGKFVLNDGKGLVDSLGGVAIKFKEDMNAIAMLNFILMNGEKSDSKHSDTKFSVRFDVSDMKWHATNLDNRKEKIKDEEALIKKVLSTDEGKELKKKCLDSWTKVFDPSDGDSGMTFFLQNFKELGFKGADKNLAKYVKTLAKLGENFDEVKKQFS